MVSGEITLAAPSLVRSSIRQPHSNGTKPPGFQQKRPSKNLNPSGKGIKMQSALPHCFRKSTKKTPLKCFLSNIRKKSIFTTRDMSLSAPSKFLQATQCPCRPEGSSRVSKCFLVPEQRRTASALPLRLVGD